jgi:cob(I)alamin adenosyltransferase
MAFKIYTKTGDKGTTSLIGGTKVEKSHLRIETYGTVDELNAHIGFCHDHIENSAIKNLLLEIQDRLFTIGSSLATDPEKEPKMKIPDLKETDIQLLEKQIDRMTEELPPMTAFILPGGHPTVSALHIARCVCRRAERCCVRMQHEGMEIVPMVIIYINRLSDYLFVLSRYMGKLLNVEEIKWKPRV